MVRLMRLLDLEIHMFDYYASVLLITVVAILTFVVLPYVAFTKRPTITNTRLGELKEFVWLLVLVILIAPAGTMLGLLINNLYHLWW